MAILATCRLTSSTSLPRNFAGMGVFSSNPIKRTPFHSFSLFRDTLSIRWRWLVKTGTCSLLHYVRITHIEPTNSSWRYYKMPATILSPHNIDKLRNIFCHALSYDVAYELMRLLLQTETRDADVWMELQARFRFQTTGLNVSRGWMLPHHILIFPSVCLCALTLYPATDCAAVIRGQKRTSWSWLGGPDLCQWSWPNSHEFVVAGALNTGMGVGRRGCRGGQGAMAPLEAHVPNFLLQKSVESKVGKRNF